jgi:hypothetical protein
MTVTFRGREVTHPAARAGALAGATTALALTAAWTLFWVLLTFPIHAALRATGGRGFLRKGDDGDAYRVPWWVMLLVALVCTAPLTLAALGAS